MNKKEMVALLYRDVHDGTGSYPVKDENGNLIDISHNTDRIVSYLRKVLNCDRWMRWDTPVVRNFLNLARPVIVWGKSDNDQKFHSFILDGIRECWGRVVNVPRDVEITYIHANFGLKGEGDGYYLMELDNVNIVYELDIPAIFKTSALSIVPHIRNK